MNYKSYIKFLQEYYAIDLLYCDDEHRTIYGLVNCVWGSYNNTWRVQPDDRAETLISMLAHAHQAQEDYWEELAQEDYDWADYDEL